MITDHAREMVKNDDLGRESRDGICGFFLLSVPCLTTSGVGGHRNGTSGNGSISCF